MWLREDKDLSMPAGRVLVVIVVALALAAFLNSEALVRAGEGMKDGPTRDIVLSVGRPLDDVAGSIGLHLPREGLDLAFGQEPKTASGTELESGSTAILRRRKRATRRFRQPTAGRPLRVFVTGDSQAEFVGQRLVDVAPEGLLRVDVVARNGTGLTRPEFFNWEVNATPGDRRPATGRGGDAHGRERRLQRARGRAVDTGRSRRSGRPSTPAAQRW